jgi:trehalose 6-phosphate synthase
LSSFAGAAKQLDAALMVNPHDIDGMARQIATALAMSLDERRERWHSTMATLRGSSVQDWFADFLRALADTHHTPIRLPRPATWPVVLDLASRTAQRH